METILKNDDKNMPVIDITIRRILSDINDLIQNPLENEGIYFVVNEENIFNCKAMIIGPPNTPYEGGFYFFEIVFPKDYPSNPPKMRFMTLYGDTRFNPNLYEDGKVCLSILNTWKGPSWTPCNTLRSVLVSLLGLVFIEHPLTNEPSYENAAFALLDRYDSMIEHENFKIAVVMMLRNPTKDFEVFLPFMMKYYHENYSKYMERIKSLKKKRHGQTKQLSVQVYKMIIVIDYQTIIQQMEILHQELKKIYDDTKPEPNPEPEPKPETEIGKK